MTIDLRGRTIVITGASAGIGEATALRCAEAGMPVVLVARRRERLEGLARRIAEGGGRSEIVVGDVAEHDVTVRALDAAETLGGPYAVFANAGIGTNRPLHEESDADGRVLWETNYFAALDLCRTAAQRLIAGTAPGHLLMCSSAIGRFALPRHGTYCATKAAQVMACAAMRHELRPHGIAVSSVHPITTTTEFFEVSAQRDGRAPRPLADRAPSFMIQSADRVARAVVACLRRPRPEVWTSLLARTAAAAFTLWPSLADRATRGMD